MTADDLKRAAAARALEYVTPGCKIGLGTGSTAALFVALLAERVKTGLKVTCVPTSEATREQAQKLGLKVVTLDELPHLDLAVDGADEITRQFAVMKGGGGALVREKIVAMAADRMIVIADESKFVETLGRFPLPLEVLPFGAKSTAMMIEAVAEGANCEGPVKLRLKADGKPFVTDNGNYIFDCSFGRIEDPDALADMLGIVPGLVGHGLFLDIADVLIVAGRKGVEVIEGPVLDLDEDDDAESKPS